MFKFLQEWTLRMGRTPLLTLGVIASINVLVLLGWAVDSDALLSPISSMPMPNPVSAVLFLLLTPMICFPRNLIEIGPWVKRSVLMLCAVVGLMEYLELFLRFDFSFDTLFFSNKLAAYQLQTGKSAMMSPNVALSFFLMGIGSLFTLSSRKRLYEVSGYLFVGVFFLSLTALIGYMYGATKFSTVEGFKGMSLQSAICFILLSSYAIQDQPNWGFMKTLYSGVGFESRASASISISMMMLILGGYLCLYFFQEKQYKIELLLATFVTVQITLVIYVQIVGTKALYDNDLLRQEKEKEIARLNKELEKRVLERTAELNAKTAYLMSAEEIGHIGSWGHDFLNDSVFWSQETYRILGIDFDTKPSLEHLLSLIHPDDLMMVKETIEKGRSTLSPFSYRARIIRPDGSLRYIFVRCRYSLSEKGEPLQLLGVIQDTSGTILLQHENELTMVKLVDRNKKLEAFAHTVSHELRAPAATMLGLIQFLQQGLSDQEQEEIVKGLKESGSQLDAIIRKMTKGLEEKQ